MFIPTARGVMRMSPCGVLSARVLLLHGRAAQAQRRTDGGSRTDAKLRLTAGEIPHLWKTPSAVDMKGMAVEPASRPWELSLDARIAAAQARIVELIRKHPHAWERHDERSNR
jgi:hypothetical protein